MGCGGLIKLWLSIRHYSKLLVSLLFPLQDPPERTSKMPLMLSPPHGCNSSGAGCPLGAMAAKRGFVLDGEGSSKSARSGESVVSASSGAITG